ncbi:MAG: flagellar biosynthesis anti-sigma factor FlgM [Gammaproteobacteria bacterium]
MPIEINGHSPSQLRNPSEGSASTQKSQQETTADRSNAAGGSQQDKVSLTDTGALLQRLSDRIAEQPAIDSQRVESIRQAIAAGSYEIDPVRVAEKMISFESALAEGA